MASKSSSASSSKHDNTLGSLLGSTTGAGSLRKADLRAFVARAQDELLHAANTHISQLAVLHETAVERIRSTALERINELRSEAGLKSFTGLEETSKSAGCTSGGAPRASGGNRKRPIGKSNKLAVSSPPPSLHSASRKRGRGGSNEAENTPASLPAPVPCQQPPPLYHSPKGTSPPRPVVAQAAASLLAQGGLTLSLLDEAALSVMGDDMDITMPPPHIPPRTPSTPEAVQAALSAGGVLPWARTAIEYHSRRKQHFVRTPLHPNWLPPAWLPAERGAAPPVQAVTHFLRLNYFSARSGKSHEGWWLQFPIGTREYSVRVHLGRQRGDAAAAAAAAAATSTSAAAPTGKGKQKRFVVSGTKRGSGGAVEGGDRYKPTWLGWLLIADAMERRSLGLPSQRAVHFALTPGELQWVPVEGGRGGGKHTPLALPYWPTGNPPTPAEQKVLDGTATSLLADGNSLPVGSPVLCNWLNTGCMWTGKVATANADGSYHIMWTDGSGEHEWSVPRHRLELETDGDGDTSASEHSKAAPPSKRKRPAAKRTSAGGGAASSAAAAASGSSAEAARESSSPASPASPPHVALASSTLASEVGGGDAVSNAAMGVHSAGGAAWQLEGERLGLALWSGEPLVQPQDAGGWMGGKQ